MTKRIEAGTVLAAVGAVVVLVSLFLDWFSPDLSAWTTFELVDLILAAIAATVLGSSVARLARGPGEADAPDLWLPAAAALGLALVVATLLNHPPAAIGLDVESGIWIALGGAVAMVVGTLADRAQVSLSFSFTRPETGRRQRRAADAEPPAPEPPPGEETRPLDREP